MRKIGLWAFLLCFLISCSNKGKKRIEYFDLSLEEIITQTQDAKMPFCVILIDSIEFTSQDYIHLLEIYNTLPKNKKILLDYANYNNVNNQWITKLIQPQIYPVTCIFSSHGKLIDLIPGKSSESYAYIKDVLLSQSICEFHYNQLYGYNKFTFVEHINKAIEIIMGTNHHIDMTSQTDSLFASFKNIYLLYYKMRNQLDMEDRDGAKKTAKEFLSYQSAHNMIIFNKELLEVNNTLDSTYTIVSAPSIISDTEGIFLPKCVVNNSYPLKIGVTNKGEKPLCISDIETSCSCVELKCDKQFIVAPHKTITINFIFKPDITGTIQREIYIISNSRETPIYTISISADVKESI